MHGRASARVLAAIAGAWVVRLADPALAAAAESAPAAEEPAGASEGEAAEPATDGGAAAEPEVAEPDAPATDDRPSDPSAKDGRAEAAEAGPTEEPREPAAKDDRAEVAEPEVAEPTAPKVEPPRIDGTYIGGTMLGGVGLVRVNDFDTPGAFASFGGSFSVGQMVFPWLGLGLHGGGGGSVHSKDGVRQKLGQGHLGVQFKFVPLPKRRVPLSLLASFGFGGGAVRQEGIAKRSGFGGAQFGAAVRYELFPWAKKRRPYRGGGFGLGPELGWVGFTPAAPERPMYNVFYLAVSATFYFGD